MLTRTPPSDSQRQDFIDRYKDMLAWLRRERRGDLTTGNKSEREATERSLRIMAMASVRIEIVIEVEPSFATLLQDPEKLRNMK